MLQRIQTLYLLLVVVLTSITLFTVQAGFISNTNVATQYILNFKGVSQVLPNGLSLVQNTWALTAISALIPAVALVTIFLFKKRFLQIRLSIVNIVLLGGYYALLFIYLWQAGVQLDAKWYLKIVTAFPLVSIVLTFMSLRAIGRDEALIKSLNRIR
ncbi:MAG: DUF4293 domain-containing protein [Paludibacter sp.]